MVNISKNSRLVYSGKVIHWEEIQKNIERFSSLLDIKKGDRVCIYSYNRPEWIYSFFGIWKQGGIPVPIDFMSTPEEIGYIINDCEPKFIFTSQDKVENIEKALKIAKSKVQIIVFENLLEEKRKKKSSETNEEDIAVILYTSGTTGEPKGVVLTFKNLLSNIKGLEATNIADEKDSTIAILPFHHSYPLMVSMLFPMYIGAKIVFIKEITPEEILSTLQQEKITVLIGVPRLYELFHRRIFTQINQHSLAKLLFKTVKTVKSQKAGRIIFKKVHSVFGGNIKYFVSGGAKLDMEVAKDLWTLGFKIIEGYGLTETSPIVSFNPPDKIKLGSVGKPIKGVKVKIVNDEILVKGDNVMKEYWRKPEETKKIIKDRWLYTGDIGFLDEEGYLYIEGRKKDIIVLPSGKNINPEEIEKKLTKISDIVKEAAVIYKDGRLIAVIFPDFDNIKRKGIINLEETIRWNIIDKLNQTLPDYKKISGFKIVKRELPKTRLGKIRRFLLEDFLKEPEKKSSKIKQPSDTEYIILKEYLEKVSKTDIHPDSHIEIDLGLDSLEKVELLSFIESTFGVEINEKELAERNTVYSIFELIKEKKKKIETTPVNWKKILSQEIEIDITENPYPLIITKKILKPVLKLYFGLQISGINNLPEGNFIIAPNHQSLLDGFFVISALPDKVLKNTYFLAEETYFPEGIKQKIGKMFHVLTVNINKDLKGSLQKTASLLRKGKNVVIFPEGARTRDGRLLPFKKAFAILSKELGVPVVPVAISGAFEAFPIGSKFPKPHKIKIEFLKPVYPEGDIDNIVSKTQKRIQEKLNLTDRYTTS